MTELGFIILSLQIILFFMFASNLVLLIFSWLKR